MTAAARSALGPNGAPRTTTATAAASDGSKLPSYHVSLMIVAEQPHSAAATRGGRSLDVEVFDEPRILLDEVVAQLGLPAHEALDDRRRVGRQRDAQQRPFP